MDKGVLVFDMDGVLVDVHASYRETIRETVRHFTGKEVSHVAIQDYKNAGGWNNDWALSHRICQDFGVDVPYGDIVSEFQRVFFGENGTPGLMERERWLPKDGLLERLAEQWTLCVFTGREHEEARITLRRFQVEPLFALVVGSDDVRQQKPDPAGLIQIGKQYPVEPFVYVGDTIDDAMAAESAEVPFIGIASAHNPKREELLAVLRKHGARSIVENINELEGAL